MILPSPVEGRPEVEYTDRTTAAYALHAAVHERLGQHTTESPEPNRLPQPLKLGSVYGVDLSTSGDDQTSEDPTVVVWLGTARSDSLRMSYSRFTDMTGPELLAAIEWRAAQAAGLLGTPLSPTWRTAVRSILPAAFPAQPTPAQLADLLDTIAQGPDGSAEHTRRRAEQALSAYTAGHPDLALDVLAADDHIWVLRNDGSWTQEEATQQTWEELDNRFSQEAAELTDISRAAAELPPADETPLAADLTVAHHSAHEALAALRPYSIGLPGTIYEKITDLVAQMDAGEPALRRLHGPGGEQLMNRAKRCAIRILEGLATVASKIRLTGLGNRLERTIARLRGQDPDDQTVPRAVRTDRRMQDLSHIERDLERRMASPATSLAERGELQEQWIINRARWRARYEQLNGQPPGGDFLPDNGLVAGAPPVPNLVAAHELLLDRLADRVAELRDTDPHTGEDANPYEPTADLLNGVAWAYQQRLIGIVPTGVDPQGPILPAQLRQAALTVTAHQNASPLTLRRTMNVTAERADRLLHRLEEQQILGPYRADAPRTVLARAADIDTLLARPATPTGPRTPPDSVPNTKSPAPTPADAPEAAVDELVMTRLRKLVSKIIADKETRSATGGEPDPADGTAPASRVRKNLRKSAHQEAEDNALAAGHSTSLAQSQS
ncbi:DNA translocase FtsK [Streptomyces sp. NPDC005877]